MDDRPIPTYFSHSYRPADKELNEMFWKMFEQEGFFFSIDPPSSLGVHTHLERMMIDSSCYVGVVNSRVFEKWQGYSTFVRFEYGLALQAQRPILLLLDSLIADRKPFDSIDPDERFIFSPELPEERLDELRDKIIALKDRVVRAPEAPERRRRGPIGLIVSKGARRCGGNRKALEETIRGAGFDSVDVLIPFENNGEFALRLAACEAVIVEVRGDEVPEWVFAYIYGRLVPSIKLVQLRANELASDVTLPPLVRGLRMDEDEPGVESLVYWRDREDLLGQIRRVLRKLQRGPVRLRSDGQGEIYFKSIGRRPARVFISSSGDLSDTAIELVRYLDKSNIRTVGNVDAFHYKKEKQIKVGDDFWKIISDELEKSEIFVALIGKGYQSSEWCMQELEIALKRGIKVLPFHVDGVGKDFLERMVKTTSAQKLPDEGAAEEVFDALSDHLTQGDNQKNWRAEQPLPLGASVEAIIDALRCLTPAQLGTLGEKLKSKEVAIDMRSPKKGWQRRSLAEKVFEHLERHPTPRGLADEGLSPLSYMVGELVAMVRDDRRRQVLERIFARMRKSFRAHPGEES